LSSECKIEYNTIYFRRLSPPSQPSNPSQMHRRSNMHAFRWLVKSDTRFPTVNPFHYPFIAILKLWSPLFISPHGGYQLERRGKLPKLAFRWKTRSWFSKIGHRNAMLTYHVTLNWNSMIQKLFSKLWELCKVTTIRTSARLVISLYGHRYRIVISTVFSHQTDHIDSRFIVMYDHVHVVTPLINLQRFLISLHPRHYSRPARITLASLSKTSTKTTYHSIPTQVARPKSKRSTKWPICRLKKKIQQVQKLTNWYGFDRITMMRFGQNHSY